MSDGPPIIRRGATHATIWRLWSAAEAKRLAALPATELLLAVQMGAIGDLTPDDQAIVLAALAAGGYGHVSSIISGGQRKPVPFKGLGLPIKVRPPVQRHRICIGLAVALTFAAWGVTIALGCADLTPHIVDAP